MKMTDEEIVALAKKAHHSDGSVEIDEGAEVSRGAEGGCYVAAWVWVDIPDLEEEG